jgi:Tol biopolymer transport system component
MQSRPVVFVLAGVFLLSFAGGVLAGDSAGETTRVSVSSTGEEANPHGYPLTGIPTPSITADGRYVALSSTASTLVEGDTNGLRDVFVRDTVSGATTRVSLSTSGRQGNRGSGTSEPPALSDDGRYVAFSSTASNLVGGDTNHLQDVFVRDRQAGTTERVSVATGGEQANERSLSSVISADGRYVLFQSFASNLVAGDTNGVGDVFMRDRATGTTTRVSVSNVGEQGNGISSSPAVSDDGRYVAFASYASNLVVGDTNGVTDVFVRDMQTGTTTRASVASGGAEAQGSSSSPSISAGGSLVAFDSLAANLVPGDTNGSNDVFVHDRQTSATTRVSVASGGTQAND